MIFCSIDFSCSLLYLIAFFSPNREAIENKLKKFKELTDKAAESSSIWSLGSRKSTSTITLDEKAAKRREVDSIKLELIDLYKKLVDYHSLIRNTNCSHFLNYLEQLITYLNLKLNEILKL